MADKMEQLNTQIFIDATIHGVPFTPLAEEDLKPKSYHESLFDWAHQI